MTDQTASKEPQIRFKGHEGNWDKKMLGDEPGEIIAGGDVEKHKLFERGKYPVLANALQKHGILGFYKSDFRVKAPAVTVTGRGDVGHALVRETNFTPVVRLLSIKSSHNVYFLKESINNHKVLVESTGIPQLTVPQLSRYQISFPGSIREENQVGEYFRELDRLIGLHQRKHDKLVTLKKAMLQKMFPQPGATTPEIRFKGFSGEWAKNTLKDAADITTGFPFKSTDFCDSGTYLVVTNGNIQSELSFVDATAGSRIDIGNSARLVQFILRVGDILVTMDGSVGRIAKVRENNQILAQRVGRLVAKSNPEFLYQVLSTGAFLEAMTTISHGGTIKHISMNEIGGYPFFAPSSGEEQQRIGTYFRTLDALISQHATQLQKLQQLKSACLEKMFV